ncbi:hypothetical protein [Bradyrhizobium australiense]|uniref:Uncharacterized protein n=1 Tax=Bradyrhizobium australiense TaxID=2721161 RepID=A0A7Y4GQQ6_9BRAD|nr:hypothetical protein [Bradyrhizobium australiense]NOJ39997.1 hypothetical protein [Bradyrhizobium australiense]
MMRPTQIAITLALTVALLDAGTALAQTSSPAAPTPMKTIGGANSAAKPELIQSLIVMNSRGATLQGDKLTLIGVAPNSIVFADRPVRLAGHEPTAMLLEDWGKGNDNFTKDPPNATISAFSKDGSSVKDAVVVLKTPKIEGDNLTFTVQLLEGDITGADGPASLFIDIFGVWRRAAFRGVVYAGAVGAAAYAAAPYYGRPACGYYPYPPCY